MKRQVKVVLAGLGWELRQARLEGWLPHKLRPLSGCATIIDVGVWRGTPSLYEAFPEAYLLLVDPLPEAEPHMRAITSKRPGSYECLAASDRAGQETIQVTRGSAASTLHHRSPTAEHWFEVVDELVVETRTLDEIVASHSPPKPYLVKIDTEGHELHTLRGAKHTLKAADCVILELSVSKRFEESYRFSEVVRLLDDEGFELADVLTIKRDIPTTRARFMDAAFVRRSEDVSPRG